MKREILHIDCIETYIYKINDELYQLECSWEGADAQDSRIYLFELAKKDVELIINHITRYCYKKRLNDLTEIFPSRCTVTKWDENYTEVEVEYTDCYIRLSPFSTFKKYVSQKYINELDMFFQASERDEENSIEPLLYDEKKSALEDIITSIDESRYNGESDYTWDYINNEYQNIKLK